MARYGWDYGTDLGNWRGGPRHVGGRPDRGRYDAEVAPGAGRNPLARQLREERGFQRARGEWGMESSRQERDRYAADFGRGATGGRGPRGARYWGYVPRHGRFSDRPGW